MWSGAGGVWRSAVARLGMPTTESPPAVPESPPGYAIPLNKHGKINCLSHPYRFIVLRGWACQATLGSSDAGWGRREGAVGARTEGGSGGDKGEEREAKGRAEVVGEREEGGSRWAIWKWWQ